MANDFAITQIQRKTHQIMLTVIKLTKSMTIYIKLKFTLYLETICHVSVSHMNS